MLAAERLNKIKEILLEYKHIDVSTLSSLLSVSFATVRRDLDKLEQSGFLVKTYGGAMLNESENSEIVLGDVEDPYIDEKIQIAKICSKLVQPYDIVFLGFEPISLYIAKYIKQIPNIKIITNVVPVINELCGDNMQNIVVPGGRIEKVCNMPAFVGNYSYEGIKKMHITKAFISAEGADFASGYTCMSEEVVDIYKHVLDTAIDTYVTLDYSVFSRRSFCSFAKLDQIPNVITNVQLAQDYKEFFTQKNINVYMSYSDIYV